MALKNQNFEMYASNDVELDLALLDENGDPLDLTDAVVRWALASAYDPGAPLVTKTSEGMSGILITDAMQGLAIVTLARSDTADFGGQPYVHEAAVIDSGGSETTVLTGAVTIYKTALQ